MKKSNLEAAFRHFLADAMRDHWHMTWHEDGGISPGVPDLHYVMKSKDNSFNIGWLELKACSAFDSNLNFKVEPSQHAYFEKWARLMPIHFCIRIGDRIVILDAKHHRELALCKKIEQLIELPITYFHKSDISKVLTLILKKVTAK